jgi:2-pyrone-4,6-dicarboxylate lactonase
MPKTLEQLEEMILTGEKTESGRAITRNTAYDNNPRPPEFIMPEGAINAHCHVNSTGTAEFPYSDDTSYIPNAASWRQLDLLDTKLGFNGGSVLVAATCHGTDNSFMLEALRQSKGFARGVVFLNTREPKKANFIADNMLDQTLIDMDAAGVRGVRYSFVQRLTDAPKIKEITDIAKRFDRLQKEGKIENKWHIDIYCEPQELNDIITHKKDGVVEEKTLMETLLDRNEMPLPVCFDHMAVPPVFEKDEKGAIELDADGKPIPNALGLEDPSWQSFRHLLKMRPDFIAKVTCPERLTGTNDVQEWQHAAAFGQDLLNQFPGQVITGTDWPHPNMKPTGQMPNDGDIVNHWVGAITQRDPQKLQELLVDNPNKLFDFSMRQLRCDPPKLNLAPAEKPGIPEAGTGRVIG